MITVSPIIETARDLHPLFDENTTPSLVALRRLRAAVGQVYQQVIQIDPARFEKCHDIDVETYDFDTGDLLPEALYYVGRSAVHESGRERSFHILDQREALSPTYWPSGYIKDGRTLCLIGTSESWGMNRLLTVKVGYVPPVPALENGSSTIAPLPDEAGPYLEAELAYFMATRLQGRPDAPSVRQYKADRNEALEAFLFTIGNQKVAKIQSILPG